MRKFQYLRYVHAILQSDHYLITFNIIINSNHTRTQPDDIVTVFDYNRANFEDMNEYIMNTDLSLCYSSSDVEFVWSYLKQTIWVAMNQFIPKIIIKPNHYPKWYTPSLKHQTNCLRSLRKRFSKSPTDHLKKCLQTAEVNLAKQIFQQNLLMNRKLIQDFATTNQAKIFHYIKDLTKSDYIPQRLFHNDYTATDEFGQATLYNNYFYSVHL